MVGDGSTHILYEGSFGYADSSRALTLSSSNTFYVGSITKEFNGAGILLLNQRGKLKLTDKVSQYLTGYPAWADSIEIGHLLNYTSGLPDVPDSSESAAQQALSQLKALAFEPGKAYLYSYANVFFQKKIIDEISGVPYHSFMSSQILLPCHVTEGLDTANRKPAMPFTNSFRPAEFDASANENALFTGRDLFDWMGCLASGKVLNEMSVRHSVKALDRARAALEPRSFQEMRLSHTNIKAPATTTRRSYSAIRMSTLPSSCSQTIRISSFIN